MNQYPGKSLFSIGDDSFSCFSTKHDFKLINDLGDLFPWIITQYPITAKNVITSQMIGE